MKPFLVWALIIQGALMVLGGTWSALFGTPRPLKSDVGLWIAVGHLCFAAAYLVWRSGNPVP